MDYGILKASIFILDSGDYISIHILKKKQLPQENHKMYIGSLKEYASPSDTNSHTNFTRVLED